MPHAPDSQLTEFKYFKCYMIPVQLIFLRLITSGSMFCPCGSNLYHPPPKAQTIETNEILTYNCSNKFHQNIIQKKIILKQFAWGKQVSY